MGQREKVTHVVNTLFPIYMDQPNLLPSRWQADIEAAKNDTELARLVSDYVSGMTDRFALHAYSDLTGKDILHDQT